MASMTRARRNQKGKGRVAARRTAAASVIAALVIALAACSNSPTGSTSKNNGITIAPDSASISVGASVTLTAALATGGSPPASFFWSSSDTTVAVVSQTGLVSGRATGNVQIAASAQGALGVATVVVVQQGAGSIVVVPATATLRVNSTLQLSDTVKDSAGKVLTGRTTTWASGNASIASVDAAGLVVAHAVGTTQISATSGTATGSSTITVTLVPVASVSVQPRDPTVQAGQTAQLTAIPLDSAGNPLAGITITWQSLNTDLATVSSNGLVTGVAPGTAVIQATAGTKTGADSVLVTAVPIGNVVLSLPTSVLLVGQTEQLSVQVTDANGHPVKDPSVKFSTSDATVATVSDKGIVAAIGPGTAIITGTSHGKSGSVTVQVTLVPVASVVVTPVADTLAPGQQATLHAAVLDSAGDPLPGRVVVWSSSNTGVATIRWRRQRDGSRPGNRRDDGRQWREVGRRSGDGNTCSGRVGVRDAGTRHCPTKRTGAVDGDTHRRPRECPHGAGSELAVQQLSGGRR